MVDMKKDEKKADNWLYLIKQRGKKDSTKNNLQNQEVHSV